MHYLFTKIPDGCKTLLLTILLSFGFVNAFSTTLSLGNSATQTKTPVNFYYTDTYQGCQMIYTADELGDLRNGAEITAISFYYENASTSAVPSINFSIKMGTTTAEYFTSNTNLLSTSSLTQVANTTIGGWTTKSSGWVTIKLSTPFKYTGGNILIDIRNTAKGAYSNDVYFASSTVSNYKTLSWTGASSATATSISSGSRTTARPNIQFTYTLYSDLTGESGITYIYSPEPGKFFQLYEEAGFPSKVKVGGYLGSKDFEDLSQCYYSDYEDHDYYFEKINYLDLSEITLESNRLSFDFSSQYWINKLVLPDNCEFFETYYYFYSTWYYNEPRIIENVYTRNNTPFGMTYNNQTGVLHVPSGTKEAWEEQLAKGDNNGNKDNSLNNCMVVDTPIKTVSSYNQLTSSDIANVDILTINGNVDARTFKALNSMPQLNKLVINGNIVSYTGSDGPIDAYTFYPENEIPANAFKDNKTLHYIELSNCNNIGDSAFKNATNLYYFKKRITSNNMTSQIGNYAFDGCVKLSRIDNSGGNDYDLGFTSIGDFAFRNTRLSNIELSSRMAYLDIWDDGSEDIENPNYVPFTHVGKNPFFGVYSSSGVKSRYHFERSTEFEDNYGPFSLHDDCNPWSDAKHPGVYLLIKDSTLYASAFTYTEYNMDSKIHHVLDYGISDVCLQDITISGNLTTIGEAFLYKCQDLKSIKGRSNAFVAKDSVLYTASMDKLIKYPSKHPLTEFHMPKSVKSIEKWAFEGVKNLKDLYVYENKPIDVDNSVFEGVDKNTITIYVPFGAKKAYSEAEVWKEFVNIEEFAVYYKVTYIVDGEVYATDSIACGDNLTLISAPTKEGYTFSGWSEAPATMPAEDVIISGTFAVNSYKVTYIVDGEVYATDSIAFSDSFTLIAAPTKEGYTFSGWSEAPATMPAEDVIISGTFTLDVVPANNKMNIDALSTAPDREFVIPVNMSNESEITALQFDLYLPEGITILNNEDDEPMIALATDRKTSTHSVTSSRLEDGAIRIVAFSSQNEVFKGNEGALVNVTVKIPATLALGDYTIAMKNIRLIAPDVTEYVTPDVTSIISVSVIPGDVNDNGDVTMADVVATVNYVLQRPSDKFNILAADVTGDGNISVADVVGIVNIIMNPTQNTNGYNAKRGSITRCVDHLSMNNVRAEAGCASLPLSLENATAYTAFQMDVELPEGVTLASASLGERAAANHSIAWKPIADNKVRVVAYSLNNSSFSGNAGELVTLDVQVADGASGVVSVDNVRMVTADGFENAISGCSSIIDLNGTTGIGGLSADYAVKVDGNAITIVGANGSSVAVYSASGALVEKIDSYTGETIILDSGIYIVCVGGKSVKVKL